MKYSLSKSIIMGRNLKGGVNVVFIDQSEVMYKFTKTAGDLLLHLGDGAQSEEELLNYLVETKNIPKNTARLHLENFIQQITKLKFLDR